MKVPGSIVTVKLESRQSRVWSQKHNVTRLGSSRLTPFYVPWVGKFLCWNRKGNMENRPSGRLFVVIRHNYSSLTTFLFSSFILTPGEPSRQLSTLSLPCVTSVTLLYSTHSTSLDDIPPRPTTPDSVPVLTPGQKKQKVVFVTCGLYTIWGKIRFPCRPSKTRRSQM